MKRAILLALLLSGCSDYYERQNEARQMSHHQQCKSYGFELGSTPYANCMLSLDQQDTATRQAVIGAYLANHAQPQPYVLPVPAPNPVPRSCTSTVNGQTIYTNCN